MTITLHKVKPRKDVEGEAVCDLMENHGWTSSKAMTNQGVSPSTFWDWVQSDPSFRARYEQARQSLAHMIAEQAIDIADEEAWTMEAVQRNKLRADTRKWYTAKIAPKIFGDRVEHDHVHRHAVVMLPPIEPMDAERALDAPPEILALPDAVSGNSE